VFELIGDEWRQKGQTLTPGNALNAVISYDGNTIVVNETEKVGVYKWNGIQWVGSPSPEISIQSFGITAISASSSCDIIQIYHQDSVANYKIFEWKDNRWKAMGDHITRVEHQRPRGIIKAELSGDGTTLITGYAKDFQFDLIDVYRYSGTEWEKMVETFQIFRSVSSFGDLSISHDGNTIAFSERNQLSGNGGRMKVMKWDGQEWLLKGDSILLGVEPTAKVELDSAGNRLGFSQSGHGPFTNPYLGLMTLLEFDGQQWNRLEPFVLGDRAGDLFGTSMSLSANGEVLVGASDTIFRRLTYIKAFMYGKVLYKPITYLSGSVEKCDRERVLRPSHYNLQLKGRENTKFILDENSTIRMPVWDSISISAVSPPNYRAYPEVSSFDRNDLETYNNKPNVFIPDTFCIIPFDKSTVDVRVDIIIPQPVIPGKSLPVVLKYSNKGTKPVSGKVEFYFDSQVQKIKRANPPYTLINANHISWNYMDLPPLEYREIELIFEMNTPMSNPPLNGGERLLYSAKIEPVEGDIMPYDNQTEAKVGVMNYLNSYDKRCIQGDTIRPESVGRPLTYVIRFENRSNAEAIDVRIRDIIDTSMLDISTFEMISASHEGYRVQISKGNVIDFTFKDIYLPFEEENNDGYVAFKMHTRENLKVGDTIKNDAVIYFDFNHPVITNEAITLVAQEPTGTINIHPQVELIAQPNPVRDFTRVSASAGILRIDLFDPSGRHLRQEVYTRSDEKNRDFNTTGLTQGIYLLRVTTEKGIGTISLIKE
jgi:uncharacterized repeat protein (TIGR01451 family)